MLNRSFTLRRVAPALVLLACALALGCSGNMEAPAPYEPSGGGAQGSEEPTFTPCNDGAQKHCTVTRMSAAGVKSCWKGMQTCEDGVWTKCQDLPEPVAGAAGADAGADATEP